MTKRQIKELETILNSAKMEKASFNPIEHPHHFIQSPYTVTFKNPEEFNSFIKAHIKLYVDTWIKSPLARLLHEEHAKIQGKKF